MFINKLISTIFVLLNGKKSRSSILEDFRGVEFSNFVSFAPNGGWGLPELSCQKHSK